ncbi:MAG: hypothetical protein K8J31_04790, partial [Anaerolineae bacterium]|nr:hypothetical protein [Anaerolineae bacterium]
VQRTARAALQRIGTAEALKAVDTFDRQRTRPKTGPLPPAAVEARLPEKAPPPAAQPTAEAPAALPDADDHSSSS